MPQDSALLVTNCKMERVGRLVDSQAWRNFKLALQFCEITLHENNLARNMAACQGLDAPQLLRLCGADNLVRNFPASLPVSAASAVSAIRTSHSINSTNGRDFSSHPSRTPISLSSAHHYDPRTSTALRQTFISPRLFPQIAHSDTGYTSRKIRKFRTDKSDTFNK